MKTAVVPAGGSINHETLADPTIEKVCVANN